MYEAQSSLIDLEKIQAVARNLVFAGYQVKEITLDNEADPHQNIFLPSPARKIKLLPTEENLKEIQLLFSAEKQEIFIIASTDAGYAFGKALCDELKKEIGQLPSCVLKIATGFSRQP